MVEEQSIVIEQVARHRSEGAAFYRFLRNKKVRVAELVHLHTRIAAERVQDRHVLVLGDSTSYNLKAHLGRLQDAERLGVLDDNRTPGFFAHAHLAVDAQSGHVLGLADLLFWMRPRAQGAKQLAREVEQRESYKWNLGAQQAQNALPSAAQLTFVLDRDADKFGVLKALAAPPRVHFITRLRYERTIETVQGIRQGLSACLAQAPVLGTYRLWLPALDHYSSTHGKRIRRQARWAHLSVRAVALHFLDSCHKPPSAYDKPFWCIEVQEITPALPVGEEAIHWRLLTTHRVETFEQAQQIVRFYTRRWMIEQLFRMTKSEGFNLEATELESVDAILAQTVLTYQAATTVLQLVYARDQPESQPLNEVFTPKEQTVLILLNERHQGTTSAQQNPYRADQTSWATWIIARLGGWKGNRTQHPPGPTTLKRGLEKFYAFVQAFDLFNPSG